MKEDETRRMIVEGAKKLFQTYGFTRITVDEIAVNLKISKKTIYKHFPTKDDLIWSVILSIQQPIAAAMVQIMDSDMDFYESTMEIVGIFQTLFPQITPPMIQDMRAIPHIWERIDVIRRQVILSQLGKLLERGQRSGDVRKDLDVKFMTTLWLHIVSTMMTPQGMTDLGMTPGEFVPKLMSTLMTGVLTEQGRKKLGGAP
jgi:AcrR family transcriptional regulator